ncbi:MAG: hypothetical protein A2Y17_05050 [Clostridiales bacterium GWF2_38_85]|nr:MAG: hypothetical protein A2Y17_05050 [Clostridiales bacterium GWF2_38_85]HBL84345.1 hypothetical protein [Clostridiales bacterium]
MWERRLLTGHQPPQLNKSIIKYIPFSESPSDGAPWPPARGERQHLTETAGFPCGDYGYPARRRPGKG